MYGQGDCNNQFRLGPLEPQFPSFRNAPPPPAHQVYPSGASGQNQPPPLPPPPPGYQAVQPTQHGHEGHPPYHHGHLSSLLPPIHQASAAPPQPALVQHGRPVPPPPVHHGPSAPLLHHVPPLAVPAPSHSAIGNFGQTYAAPPTAHGSLTIPPPYPGSQQPQSYPRHIVPQNLQHGPPPPAPLPGGPNLPRIPAPPPPLQGPITYRPNSVPLNMQVSQHAQTFPTLPPSFVLVAPSTLMSYSQHPIVDAPPPPPLSPPSQPPPPPPSSPPPLPMRASQQEIVSSSGHVVRYNQATDTRLYHGLIAKSVQTENLSESLVDAYYDSNLSKDSAQRPRGWIKKGGTVQGQESAEEVADTLLNEKKAAGLPQPPPNPSEEEVARNMTLKESEDPNIELLDGSEPGSSSAPTSCETKCTKQARQRVQTSEASPHSGLAHREMSLSPAVSDMDMEDDVYSPTKDSASHHLVDSVKVQPVPTSKHFLYEERLYAPESPTEQSPVQKASLVEASAGSSKLDIKQEEEDQRFSPGPAFEDLSSASGSPEANDNFDRTIHTSRMTSVENPQLRNPQAGIAKPCVGDVSSFQLLPNYASDDSTDEDVKPKIKDVSPVKASSEVVGSFNNAQNFFSDHSKLNSTQDSEVEMLDPTQIQPNQRETSALPCTSSSIDPNSNIKAYGTPSEVQKDACHHFVSHPLDASEITGLSPLNEQGEHDIVAVNANPRHISSPGGTQLYQEKDAKEPSTILKVDEFGRLVREGATDSDSDDGGLYSGRFGKRRRSHSRSPSTQESRWRTTHSPRRRRDRRSRSCSWSPKKERNRSRSPSFARSTGHGNEKTWRQRGQPAECFNFMHGRCFRGASCRFLHRDPAADDSSRHYRGKGYQHSEKHQVPTDFAGTMSEKHEATHLKIGISTVEYDAAFAKEEKHTERSGYVDMALSNSPTSNLRAEPTGEGASLAAFEVQSTKADAAHKVGQQVSKELEGSCQIQLSMEQGAHSPNESIQKLVGSSASSNLLVETSSQLQSIPEGKRVPAQAKLYEPAHSFQGLVAGWQCPQDGGANVHPSVRIQGVGSCLLPEQDLMPPVQGVAYLSPKPISLSQPYPSASHNVAQPLTAESPGPQQLPTRDFQACTTSGDPRLQCPGAMTSGKFCTETSSQHLAPPQPGDQILPFSQSSSAFQLKPLQQDTFPSYQPAADLRPLPSTLPRPPQNDLSLPTYVNELPLRPITSAPDSRPPYQQNSGPLRNEFVLQPPGKPYLPDEPMHSQQVGFFPQAYAAVDSHRPPFWVEDMRPWSFPSASAGDQSLGGEAFAEDPRKQQEEQFLYPTNAEGPKSEVLASRPVFEDQHLFSRSSSQLPGRSFSMPVADNLGNSHSQPFATQDSCLYPLDEHSREGNSWVHRYPKEHAGLHMHNLLREDMALRAFGGEGVSTFRDSTYSGQPSVASSSFPLQDGIAPPLSQHLSSTKGPAFPECPETFLRGTRSSLLSVIGRCQVPTTHYNPYASTFEEKPSKFEPQFDLSHVPFGAHSGSRISSRSFGSSAAPQHVCRESAPGDQYDPLFDSIEPSKKDALSKFGDGRDGETSFNTVARSNTAITISEPDFVSRLASKKQKLLNVEEDNKQKNVERIVIKPFESDEFGEATLDAEAGAVENASPMAGDEKSWSPDHPVEGNMGVGEVEIDRVHASGKCRKSKDSRSMKLFKIAVAEFVKDVLKPSWRQGNMSKEAFKTIVKKTVDKVSGAMQGHQIPKSKAKIDQYVESSQRKLTKLVMGYVDKYVKA